MRLALKYAFDRQELVDKILYGYGSAGNDNMLAPSLKYAIQPEPVYTYDPDRAKSLLKKVGGGRVAAHEIMVATPAIRNLIREDKVAQMYSSIQTGQQYGMQTLDQCLQDMVKRGLVTKLQAKEYAKEKKLFD